MRLTFVDNFIMPDGSNMEFFDIHPHLGLTSLAAVAQENGHDVVIYDPKREIRFGRRPYSERFYELAAEDILASRPDAIGFTTLGCSFLFAVKVAELIKQRTLHLTIMIGGPHATMLDRQILEAYDQFDIVVRHEAERTLPPLLENLGKRSFDAIPGVTWRTFDGAAIRSTPGQPKIENLDELPIPAYDRYPVQDLQLTLMRVEAGRGCPFSCTFCSTSTFFQRSYRLKSPGRLVSEMDLLNKRFGVSEFKLDHDLFTVDRRKVLAFCEAVKDKNYKWRVSARTDCVDEELIENMALAGCIGVYFGIETGSSRMQQICDKRLKLEAVEHILDLTEAFGIESTVSFITGYPDERKEDQEATLDMLGRCFRRASSSCIPQLHILLPEPGTPLFMQYGKSLSYDGYVTPFNARFLNETDSDHIISHPALFATYYYYPSTIQREDHVFTVDAFNALRSFGHELLSYTLRFFGGRLSRLIDELREWTRMKSQRAEITPLLVSRFISHRFGSTHHLVSLFRMGLVIGNDKTYLERANPVHEEGRPQGESDLYCLSPRAHILSDLHDCAALLARIRRLPRESQPLDDEAAGDRAFRMVVLSRHGAVAHYTLDPGVAAILTLFENPCSLDSIVEALHQVDSTNGSMLKPFLRKLVELEVIVRSTATHVDKEPLARSELDLYHVQASCA
jgi:radical SAM superfamily enzyme YgiQ (UPF0313 family)